MSSSYTKIATGSTLDSNQTSILLLFWDSVTGSGLQGKANAFLIILWEKKN